MKNGNVETDIHGTCERHVSVPPVPPNQGQRPSHTKSMTGGFLKNVAIQYRLPVAFSTPGNAVGACTCIAHLAVARHPVVSWDSCKLVPGPRQQYAQKLRTSDLMKL
eukprot:4152589-Amphidinium_carterae.1